jgi:hypothetical protein
VSDGVAYSFDGGLLVVTLSGHYTLEEMRAALAAAIGDPAFVRGARLLADARASQVVPAPGEMGGRLSLLLTLRPHIGRECAVVVGDVAQLRPSHTLAGLARNYGFNLRAFTDYDRARAWLSSFAP